MNLVDCIITDYPKTSLQSNQLKRNQNLHDVIKRIMNMILQDLALTRWLRAILITFQLLVIINQLIISQLG